MADGGDPGALPASAVFVDVENVAFAPRGVPGRFDLALVMDRIGRDSRPILRYAYADWGQHPGFRQMFLHQQFEAVQTSAINAGKNALDIQLAVDAVESVLVDDGPRIVYLLTSDSDFTPLVRTLRRHDRRIIGLGWRAKTNPVWRNHLDDFIAYEDLAGIAEVSVGREEPAPSNGRRRVLAGPVSTGGGLSFGDPREMETADTPAAPGLGPVEARPVREPRYGAEAEEPTLEAVRDLSELDLPILRLMARFGRRGKLQGNRFERELKRFDPSYERIDFGCARVGELIRRHPLLSRLPERGKVYDVVLPAQMPLDGLLAADTPQEAIDRLLAERVTGYLGPDRQVDVVEALFETMTAGPEHGFTRRAAVTETAAARDWPVEDVARVEQLLWGAQIYVVKAREPNTDALDWTVTLRESVRHEGEIFHQHDMQVIREAMQAGLVLDAARWADTLAGGSEDEDPSAEYVEILSTLGFTAPAEDAATFTAEALPAPPLEDVPFRRPREGLDDRTETPAGPDRPAGVVSTAAAPEPAALVEPEAPSETIPPAEPAPVDPRHAEADAAPSGQAGPTAGVEAPDAVAEDAEADAVSAAAALAHPTTPEMEPEPAPALRSAHPGETVITEPAGPRRSGWWSRR